MRDLSLLGLILNGADSHVLCGSFGEEAVEEMKGRPVNPLRASVRKAAINTLDGLYEQLALSIKRDEDVVREVGRICEELRMD